MLLTHQLWSFISTVAFSFHLSVVLEVKKKSKQKSPGRATSRSRSQPPTPGGREKVTEINVGIANKQMHDKHKEKLVNSLIID